MKKHKFGRKLLFSKATVANLNMDAMRRFKGGVETINLKDPICRSAVECPVETYPCPTQDPTCPNTCEATCQVTCLNTCDWTCPPCDSVMNC